MIDKKYVEQIGGQLASKVGRHITSTYFSDYKLSVVRFDWSPSRRSSRGGIYASGPGINIALNWYPKTTIDIGRFYEYRSFDSDPLIGGFFYRDPILKLQAIVVHEMAHTAQFFQYHKTGVRCKPHGPVFKKYYRELREEFINHLLPDQKTAKIEYEQIIKGINRHGAIRYS